MSSNSSMGPRLTKAKEEILEAFVYARKAIAAQIPWETAPSYESCAMPGWTPDISYQITNDIEKHAPVIAKSLGAQSSSNSFYCHPTLVRRGDGPSEPITGITWDFTKQPKACLLISKFQGKTRLPIAVTLQGIDAEDPYGSADELSEQETVAARMVTKFKMEGSRWSRTATVPASGATEKVVWTYETSRVIHPSRNAKNYKAADYTTGVIDLGETVLKGLRRNENYLPAKVWEDMTSEIDAQTPLIFQELECLERGKDRVTCTGTLEVEPGDDFPMSVKFNLVFSKKVGPPFQPIFLFRLLIMAHKTGLRVISPRDHYLQAWCWVR